ncbi:hypothetical protein [Glaesserella sp.]
MALFAKKLPNPTACSGESMIFTPFRLNNQTLYGKLLAIHLSKRTK